jgi:hypothetical protein
MDEESLDTIIARMSERQMSVPNAGFADGVMRQLGRGVCGEPSWWPLICGLLAVAGALSCMDFSADCDPVSLSWAETLCLLPVGLSACLLFRPHRSEDTAHE